ncbi:RNA binding methyltransferase FtsJ like [hydrothermal vent metagenome]|uniref:RNA binding methyltransferase FtsJ like n=1 Tax=hydrothermal vent metagenome TaxID=652676 RepID=A0A3B1E1X7_9ZZZZ
MRLDIYLVKYYNIQSRNKSYELIKSKKIKIDGRFVTKPSFHIEKFDNRNVEILEDILYVSRASLKLKYFLEEIKDVEFKNKLVLDIGSSTGGFTQVLLEYGIRSVTCVDVGSNQLHDVIRNNTKVIIQENTDIRKFKSDFKYDIITCDVSFISIHNILEQINALAKRDIIILFKPQFEVGVDVKRNRAGVVKDVGSIQRAKQYFLDQVFKLRWKLICSNMSQIEGKRGNIEELFYFKK